MPLLHAKKQLFANQLPVTYETAAQQGQAGAHIKPPTRADNPFLQYYTGAEVALGGGPDRRMSAAVDGLLYNPYADAYDAFPAQAAAHPAYMASSLLAPGGAQQAAQRRSSVAFGAALYHASPTSTRHLRPQIMAPPSGGAYVAPVLPSFGAPARVAAPRMARVQSKADLRPRVHSQPRYRRRSVSATHISPANALTVYLTETYSLCQPQRFRYSKTSNPKRVLTKPSEPKYNNGNDNEDSDYILYVNDMLGPEEGRKYVVLDLLGSGTFGQVVKCQNLANQSVVAVKVVKSKAAYLNQSLSEVKILEYLNQNSRSGNFIRLLDTFMHKEHLCLVFELLASNLYELIKQNQFQGLNMKLVKSLTTQLLSSCLELKSFQIIHCDLKPENILLCQPDKPEIKVIDFGSACFTRKTIYSYIQSRFYRSPEVILGLPYTESIDMWSLGCIVGELFLGLPMFPGSSEYNQIYKIVDMLGAPPRHMLDHGRNLLQFFDKIPSSDPNGKPTYRLKTYDEYVDYLSKQKDKGKTEQPNKNYFDQKLLKQIILDYKMPSKKMTQSMIDKEYAQRHLLIDFLTKVLNPDPLERLTPLEALKHPFVNDAVPTQEKSFSSANSTVSLTAHTQTDLTNDTIMKV
ncbi:kinase-like protein [Metschnikowia bicuspidata var. bicuspidata NRRL YB-4993]|uniref:Kinase-like protein n=1 Tax=Metschnikowia bicuspidata var. bicuspidata NRRL YB-4993 TaxID=869754 RepID=A0A1A0HB69_9ASCO|nr:kinase-like protein [Metschnikowia bicuspidata var. bicuspidata NRRL YB-4993]OBA21374.1 kinase-like protein [Metschnikowia bicuspidata var. bicuspidata NRRL YB-4993]